MDKAFGMRVLSHGESDSYLQHLLRLDDRTRRLRFGRAMDDDAIGAHVSDLAARGTQVVAMDIDGHVRGAVEIAASGPDGSRGLFFSVEPDYQGCRIGLCLGLKVIALVRPATVTMTCRRENATMITLARRLGAEVREGSDAIVCRIDTERRSHPRDTLVDADGLQPAVIALARSW